MHRLACILLAAWVPFCPAAAQTDPVEVDVELALMVDVSRSMSPNELEIQRRGYAEALTSPEVLAAIQSGILGRVAVTYVEWAGTNSQRVVVEWQLLESQEDAEAFADTLTAGFSPAMRRTSISGALDYAADLIEGNRFAGLRRVIDVSGDGPNNQGRPVAPTRDEVVSRGIVINGLPLMTRDGIGSEWNLDDLDQYYLNCVIGGPGAFMIPVQRWPDFAMAVRRKLVLELAGLLPEARPTPPERVFPAQARGGEDCMIGEKIWRRNWGDSGLP